jgi:hypothetical protein
MPLVGAIRTPRYGNQLANWSTVPSHCISIIIIIIIIIIMNTLNCHLVSSSLTGFEGRVSFIGLDRCLRKELVLGHRI